jgi:hypothetical protein
MQIAVPLQDLAARVYQMATQDGISDVTLKGTQAFGNQIAEGIKTLEVAEYGENRLDIKITE